MELHADDRPSLPRRRGLANSSLLAGMLWLVVAMVALIGCLPGSITALLGLPLAGWAVLVGWVSVRESRPSSDDPRFWRSVLGMSLGCASVVWLAGGQVLVILAVLVWMAAHFMGLTKEALDL